MLEESLTVQSVNHTRRSVSANDRQDDEVHVIYCIAGLIPTRPLAPFTSFSSRLLLMDSIPRSQLFSNKGT